MMLSFFILPGLIYFAALFFWGRYLYIHSLKKAADRKYSLQKVSALVVYIPIGLQAILLFCFSLLQVIPIGDKLASFFEFIFLTNAGESIPDFYALTIILTGALVTALNYCLAAAAASVTNNTGSILSKSLVFAAGVFFLNMLRLNISHSFSGNTDSQFIISYNSNYLLLLSLSVIVFFALIRGTWIYKRQSLAIKYFSLASRILLLYAFLVVIAAIPVIIYMVIKR
jgi:hypothetical protein